MEELLNKLVEERARAWHQGKEILDRMYDEGAESRAEDEEQWGRINAELAKLDERIEQINERVKAGQLADEARANAERFVRPAADPAPKNTEVERLRAFATGQGPKHFDVSMAGLGREHGPDGRVRVVNTLTIGTAADGGDTVPTGFREQLYEHLIENTAIRQTNVEVLTTSSGEDLLLPKTTSHTSGSIVTEGGTVLADDPQFGQATLSTYKYGRLVQVSSELLQDNAVDLVGYLARSFGQALANGAGAHFITGTGSGQPTGILTGGSIGKTGTASGGAVQADDLIDLYFAVIEPHASRGWWILNRSTLGSVRKLKDTNGQYLWQPGLAGATPNTILDRPYVTDPNVPTAATSATSVAFGDFSAYVIRDVAGIRFERSDDYAFNQDLVTFRAIMRTGGVPVGSNGEWQVFKGGTA